MTTAVSFCCIQVFLTARCGFDKVGGDGVVFKIETIQDVKKLLKVVSNSIEKSDPLHQKFE